MNQNTFTKTIAAREGLKQSVNIAQIKEVVRITLEELAKLPASEAMAMIEKHKA